MKKILVAIVLGLLAPSCFPVEGERARTPLEMALVRARIEWRRATGHDAPVVAVLVDNDVVEPSMGMIRLGLCRENDFDRWITVYPQAIAKSRVSMVDVILHEWAHVATTCSEDDHIETSCLMRPVGVGMGLCATSRGLDPAILAYIEENRNPLFYPYKMVR